MELPEITWAEVREHLVRELQIEPEYLIDDESGLTWQPHLLPVHVWVAADGHYPDGDAFLVVKAEVRVAVCDRDMGLELADMANTMFLQGSFCWSDGVLYAGCGVNVNRTSRTNLSLLHNAVLALATCAHEVLGMLDASHLPALEGDERSLGRRDGPDELLGIFAVDGYSLPGQEKFVAVWPQARSTLRRMFVARGHEPGYTADDVDFFDVGGIGVGFGLDLSVRRYGAGLRVQAIVATVDPEPPHPGYINDGNALLMDRAPAHIGNLRWDHQPGQPFAALTIAAFLPHSYVGRAFGDADGLPNAVFNALGQVRATAATFHADTTDG
jgi:hypothetical protein